MLKNSAVGNSWSPILTAMNSIFFRSLQLYFLLDLLQPRRSYFIVARINDFNFIKLLIHSIR